MEELTKSWSCLALSDVEGSSLQIKEEEAVTDFVLAAKFLTKRALNIDAIAKTFTQLWRSKNGFKIKKEGDHVILFTFDNREEIDQILEAEPWSFDKHLMVLQRFDRETDVLDIQFNRITFWVQVHGIPIRFRTRKVAEKICGMIGIVHEPAEGTIMEGDGFIRVRVTIDMSQPLSRGRVISLESGKELWVSFKYERLSNLCYWCGSLMHDDKDCDLWIASEGTLPLESQQFGAWIRAPPFVQSRRTTISVPGYYDRKKKTKLVPCSIPAKQPPVVVRRGGSSPEIIRPNMESQVAMERGNDVADFQEQNQVGVNQNSTNHGLQMESNPSHASVEIRSVSAEQFEEQIKELDHDIHKFDPPPELFTKNMSCTGKENDFESLTINEIFELGKSQARGQPLDHSVRTPLSHIPDVSNITVMNTATWRRQNRSNTGTDVIMEDTVGSKRSTSNMGSQPELQKKGKLFPKGARTT